MKAIVKLRREAGAVDVIDVSKPSDPKDDEVLLRVHSAAICGSDIHAYEFISSYQTFMTIPVVLGHEACGVVEAVGSKVTEFKPGDKVMGESNIYCGKCRNCRLGMTNICESNLMRGLTATGVMQEYALFKEENLHKVPENLSFDEGAAAQACTVSVHGVLHRININVGDNVLVSGVGIVGFAAAQLARLKGAKVLVVGTNEDEKLRLPVARKMGFHTVNCQHEDVASYCEKYFGEKADFVLECSGAASALISAVNVIKKGGEILLLGLGGKEVAFPFAQITRAEVNIITSYTSTWRDYEETLSILSSGAMDIKPLLKTYAIEESIKAFEDAIAKNVIKPVIRFS
jgi:L-iditol 2-dehydrogenase